MPPIPKNGTVAVTGAAGFIGGWVVKGLLDRGYRFRACVRSIDDELRVGFLKALPAFLSGRLTLHSADLNEPGCFDEIFVGCHGVCHVSYVTTYDDVEYIRRTCDHIAASIENSGSVVRMVVTSSRTSKFHVRSIVSFEAILTNLLAPQYLRLYIESVQMKSSRIRKPRPGQVLFT